VSGASIVIGPGDTPYVGYRDASAVSVVKAIRCALVEEQGGGANCAFLSGKLHYT
jgi:hypothetical protein